MFKIGDIIGWSGLNNDYHRVVSINAIGFETVTVSSFVRNERRFYKNPKRKYPHTYAANQYSLITKEQVQQEIDLIVEPYKKFIEKLP